ncbi:MAG: hypothetical protein ACJ731_13960 [Vicinamibacterales bacterium]
MSFFASSSTIVLIVFAALAPQKPGTARLPTAPETFRAQARVSNEAGLAGAAYVDIHIDKYSADKDREAIVAAFKSGGYPALLTALKKAPPVGTVKVGSETFVVRWARQQRSGENKRTISVVTEKPVLFVGGGSANAKPREGYELAVAQFEMDDSGVGSGTMAAAAKIKPGGTNGLEIDDYAEQPIKLVSIARSLS